MSLHPTMRAALRPFQPKDTVVSCTHPDFDGELLVEGYYEAGTKPTRVDPGEPEVFELHRVMVNGADVTLLLKESVKDDLEEEAATKCAEAAADAMYEARMARRQA